ncbi:putative outer membrane starch-binding protein [Arenibacter algicola]|uniref:Outer membrane starch-binding protein n=1 Tax=Arenibacter algicola TaxID=616991 RepID=A0ABY3AF04_9FLAO
MRNLININKLKNLKNAIPILLVVIMGTTLVSSCNDDLLDKSPLYAIPEEDVFNDPIFLNGYVASTYNGIKVHYMPAAGGLIGLTDLAFIQTQTNGIGGPGEEYLQGGMTPENVDALTNGLWAHQYKYITNVNVFMEKVESSAIDPAVLDPLVGQMLFLRAYMYFELSRHFGGVPLITQTFSLTEESYSVPRNTYDEVAAFVLSEVEKAIPLLKNHGEAPSGAATKQAAMALKARMLLYMASPLNNPNNDLSKWQAAEAATKAVIDAGFTLHPDYFELFHDPVAEDEIILARSYTSLNRVASQGGWGYNYDFWPSGFDANQRVTPTQNFVNAFQMTNGQYPYLEDGITVNPISGYDDQLPNLNRDPRYYVNVLYSGAVVQIFDGSKSAERAYEYWEDANPDIPMENPDWNGETIFDFGKDSKSFWVAGKTPFHWNIQTGYAFKKLTDFTSPRASWDHDYDNVTSYFRLGEFLLNYAEIQIALGNESLAREYINRVRKRESVNMPDVTESGDELVRVYRNERVVELNLEDSRFYDLMRWKAAPGLVDLNPARGITSLKKDWSDGGKLSYEYGEITTATERAPWPGDYYYLMPIPIDEINKSDGALEQNPGY